MKIMYYMNVDWNWIKQRPHFVAEGLSKYYETTVVYQYRYSRRGYQNREKNNRIIPLYVIPRIDRYRILKWINILLKRIELKRLIKKVKPDVIIVTSPEQVDVIPLNSEITIIYDCMDRHDAFTENKMAKAEIKKKEHILCDISTAVVTSSEFLKRYIIKEYSTDENKVSVIRNAYDGKIVDVEDLRCKHDGFKIGYFGTIASWFDFETMEKILDQDKELKLFLFGPCEEGIEIPDNSQILYKGVVEHSELYSKTKDIDVFIMPFVVNDVVEAVDPVKIYEYINFNRNIICVYYKEVERFDDMIFMYKDFYELKKIIENLKINNKNKYSYDERISFLKENDWDNRIQSFKEIVDKTILNKGDEL